LYVLFLLLFVENLKTLLLLNSEQDISYPRTREELTRMDVVFSV